MKTLRDYFDEAAQQPRSISKEALRNFISVRAIPLQNGSEADKSSTARNILTGKRAWSLATNGMIALSLGSLLITGMILLLSGRFTPVNRGANNSYTGTNEIAHSGRPAVTEGCGCPLSEFVGRKGERISHVAPTSLTTVPMLELSTEELRQLGIEKFPDNGAALYYRRGKNGGVDRDEFRTDSDGFPEPARNVPSGIAPLPFPPRLVTDDVGRLRRFFYTYDEVDSKLRDSIVMIQKKYSYLSDRGSVKDAVDSMKRHPGFNEWFAELHRRSRSLIDFNVLVPVLIRSAEYYTHQDSLSGHCRPNVIVWFDPTPEFFALLPANWHHRMRPIVPDSKQTSAGQFEGEEKVGRENKIASNSSTQPNLDEGTNEKNVRPSAREKTSSSEASQQMLKEEEAPGTGGGEVEKMLRVNPGAILQSTLLLNPVEKIGMLQMRLGEPRTVAISLHSIMGNRLALLFADQLFETGEHSLQLLFNEIPSGIYLLALSTDKGEMQVERVIVR